MLIQCPLLCSRFKDLSMPIILVPSCTRITSCCKNSDLIPICPERLAARRIWNCKVNLVFLISSGSPTIHVYPHQNTSNLLLFSKKSVSFKTFFIFGRCSRLKPLWNSVITTTLNWNFKSFPSMGPSEAWNIRSWSWFMLITFVGICSFPWIYGLLY